MLPIPDILHRTLVYSLAGICVLGVGAGVAVTRDTVRRGRGTYVLTADVRRG